MDDLDLRRMFDQIAPTQEQEATMLDRLHRTEREEHTMKRGMKRGLVALVAALAGVLGLVGLALGVFCLLGCQAVVLSGDLRQQAVEDGGGLQALCLALGLLGLLCEALLLGGLCIAAGLLLLATATLFLGCSLVLSLDAAALLFLLGLCSSLCLLGLALDLGGALCHLGAKLLADLVDVRVDKRRRMVLGGDLHLLELCQKLLGAQAKLLGQLMYSHACHILTFLISATSRMLR